MKQTFTKQFMIENKGCYDLSDLMSTSFMKTGSEEISLQSILKSEIPLKDKYWFCCRKLFTKRQNQEIAISVAEIVLEIYEKRYPDNKAPREAIQAAKDYINETGITLEELRQKRAYAAAAAADAYADAAYAYADAADAAYAAADAYAAAAADAYAAAADAAYAAAADADAAAAAADADADAAYAGKKTFKEILLMNLIDFCERSGF